MDALLVDTGLASDLVALLNEKLKSTRHQLSLVEQENASLRAEVLSLRSKVGQDALEGEKSTLQCDHCGDSSIERCEDVDLLAIKMESLQDELKNAQERSAGVISELTEQLSALRVEHERCTSELQEYKSKLDRPPVDCRQILESLPLPAEGLSDRSKLLSCLPRKCTNPRSFMTSDQLAHCSADGPLMIANRIVWLSHESPHAFMVSPHLKYEVADLPSPWKKNEELCQLAGGIRELFYRSKGRVHYAGTYKCLDVYDLPTDEYKRLNKNVKEDILRVTITVEECMVPLEEKESIRKQYTKGVLKAEFMVLQCIGFNRKLYDSLLASYQKLCPKREREDEQDTHVEPMMKKTKMGFPEVGMDVEEVMDDVTLASDTSTGN